MRWVWSLALLLTVGSFARAEDSLPSMSLSMALEYAASHHPRLLADTEDVKASEAAAAVPAKRWLPRVGVTAQLVGGSNNNSGALWLGSRGAVELPRIAGTAFLQKPSAIDWHPYLNTSVAAGFEQEIFDFGRIAAAQAVADARQARSEATREADRRDVVLSVREAYYAVQAAHQVRAAAEQAVQRATVHRDAMCALGREGLRPEADCERGKADLARYTAALSRAEGSLSSARVTYAASMGHERDEIEVDDEQLHTDVARGPTFAETIATAQQNEPRVHVVEAEARASAADAKRSLAERRPQLYGIGTVMGAAGAAPEEGASHGTWGRGGVPYVPNYYAGLVFAWRLLDRAGDAEAAAAAASAETVKSRIRELREQTKTEAAQAWIAVETSLRTLPELENALRAAEINYAKVDGRYGEGLATVIEVTDAESLRVDAQINLAIGRFDVARSGARLERALAKESP